MSLSSVYTSLNCLRNAFGARGSTTRFRCSFFAFECNQFGPSFAPLPRHSPVPPHSTPNLHLDDVFIGVWCGAWHIHRYRRAAREQFDCSLCCVARDLGVVPWTKGMVCYVIRTQRVVNICGARSVFRVSVRPKHPQTPHLCQCLWWRYLCVSVFAYVRAL